MKRYLGTAYPSRMNFESIQTSENIDRMYSKDWWKNLVKGLKYDVEYDLDPLALYKGTDAGQSLLSICADVEEKSPYYVEFPDSESSGKILVENVPGHKYGYMDCKQYKKDLLTLALYSRSEYDFRRLYKNYLEEIAAASSDLQSLR